MVQFKLHKSQCSHDLKLPFDVKNIKIKTGHPQALQLHDHETNSKNTHEKQTPWTYRTEVGNKDVFIYVLLINKYLNK